MDLVIIVAMLTPIALFFILAPVFYVIKVRRDYEKKKNMNYIKIDDAMSFIEQILEEGYFGRSYVIFTGKDSDYYVQYGLEENGFILYFFKGQIFTQIHFSKFKNVLVNHNFKEVSESSIEMLNTKEFLELNGGFNVCVGRDVGEIKSLTEEILEKVFEDESGEVNVEMEL